jgi:hypothetical protein
LLSGAIFDLHIYQAWWALPLLPSVWIPQAVHLRAAACDSREALRSFERHTSLRAMVGEWSLATTDCHAWLNGIGLGSGSLTRTPSDQCQWVRCPSTYNAHIPGTSSEGGPTSDGFCPVGPLPNAQGGTPPGPLSGDAFVRLLGEYARAGYGASAGWTWWNFRSELPDPHWSLFDAIDAGWLPRNLSSPAQAPDCSVADTPFGSAIAVAILAAGLAALSVGLAIVVACLSPCCRRRCTCCARCTKQSRERPFGAQVLGERLVDDGDANGGSGMVESLVASWPRPPGRRSAA